MRKNTLYILLGFAAGGLTIWSIWLGQHATSITPHLAKNQPDAYMESVVATAMNSEGKLAIRITSPSMIHYAENNMTHIDKPHVTVFRDLPQPWYIDSEFANLSNGLEQIIFQQNVVIHHPADISNPNTTMKTNSLTVLPHEQIAKTADIVTITQPDIIVHAIGMLANLNTGTVQLLSQTRGEYTSQ